MVQNQRNWHVSIKTQTWMKKYPMHGATHSVNAWIAVWFGMIDLERSTRNPARTSHGLASVAAKCDVYKKSSLNYWKNASHEVIEIHKKNIRNGVRKKWADPEFAQKKREQITRQVRDTAFQTKRLESVRLFFETATEHKERLRQHMIERNTAHLRGFSEKEKYEYRKLQRKCRMPRKELLAIIIAARRLDYSDAMYEID